MGLIGAWTARGTGANECPDALAETPMCPSHFIGPNPLSPEEMSSKERLGELAEILATGICRLQMRQAEQLRQEAAKLGRRASRYPDAVRPRGTDSPIR